MVTMSGLKQVKPNLKQMTQKNSEAGQDVCKKNIPAGKKQEANQLFKSVGSPIVVNLCNKSAINRIENNGSSLKDASKASKMS